MKGCPDSKIVSVQIRQTWPRSGPTLCCFLDLNSSIFSNVISKETPPTTKNNHLFQMLDNANHDCQALPVHSFGINVTACYSFITSKSHTYIICSTTLARQQHSVGPDLVQNMRNPPVPDVVRHYVAVWESTAMMNEYEWIKRQLCPYLRVSVLCECSL